MLKKIINKIEFFLNKRKKTIIEPQAQYDQVRPKKIVAADCEFALSTIGDYSYVSPGSKIHSTDIGKFCSIGPNVIIGYGEHPLKFLRTSPLFYYGVQKFDIKLTDTDHFNHHERVKIGNDVWIGANVYIRNGVSIGDGVVIAAGSVVVKDVPEFSVYGGVPAKLIKMRFTLSEIDKIKKIKWWDFDSEQLIKFQEYFVTEGVNTALDNIYKKIYD